jgi:tape measure domain-containing protein
LSKAVRDAMAAEKTLDATLTPEMALDAAKFDASLGAAVAAGQAAARSIAASNPQLSIDTARSLAQLDTVEDAVAAIDRELADNDAVMRIETGPALAQIAGFDAKLDAVELSADRLRSAVVRLDTAQAVDAANDLAILLTGIVSEIGRINAAPIRLDAGNAGQVASDLAILLTGITGEIRRIGATPIRLDAGNAEQAASDMAILLTGITSEIRRIGATPINFNEAAGLADLRKLQAEVDQLRAKLAAANATPLRVADDGLTAALGRITQVASGLGVLPGRLGAVASRVASLTVTLGPMVQGLTGGATASGALATATAALVSPVGLAAAAVAGALTPALIGGGVAAAALNSEVVQLAGQMEQTAISFEVMVGSASLARQLLGEIQAFADTTPFKFPELAASARLLIATGTAAGDVVGELRMLGDVAAGTSQPIGEIAYVYGQIRSQQVAYTQDLNQFATRGIPIFRVLGDVLQTDAAGVRRLAAEGAITADVIQAAFKRMTSAGGQYAGLTERQSQSLLGLQSTAADTYAGIQRQVGDVLIANLELKAVVQEQTAAMETIGPVAVAAAAMASNELKPLVDVWRSLLGLVGKVSELLMAIPNLVDAAFGDGASAKVAKFTGVFPGLTIALKLVEGVFKTIAWTLDQYVWLINKMADGIQAVKTIWSDDDGKTGYDRTIQDADVRQRVKEKHAKAEAAKDKTDAMPAGKAPAGSEGVPPINGGPAGKAADKSADKAEADRQRSLDRAAQLEAETIAARMRAAGRDAHAEEYELLQKYAELYHKAGSDAERAAVEARREVERAALAKKQAEEQARLEREKSEKIADAALAARLAELRAAGNDVGAELLELDTEKQKRFKLDDTDAQRAAIMAEFAARRQQILDDANKEAQKKQEDADEKAKRQAETVGDYLLQAQVATLQAQGRMAEAEMAEFDAGWRKKIEAAKTGEERIAAEAAYAAQRRLKEQELGGEGPVATGGDKGGYQAPTAADTTDELKGRIKSANGLGERRLAQLDLQERFAGSLTEDEAARRDRLRARFGAGVNGAPGPAVDLAAGAAGASALRDQFARAAAPTLPTGAAAAAAAGAAGQAGGQATSFAAIGDDVRAMKDEVKLMHTSTLKLIEEHSRKFAAVGEVEI